MTSEVFNMDCVAYMRTLPDNFFDIAICDPPYGDAESGNFHLGGGLEAGSTATNSQLRFHGGDRWNRYKKPQITPPQSATTSRLESTHKAERGRQSTSARQPRLRRQIQPILGGGGKQKASHNALTGMLPHRRSSSMSFSA